MVIECEIQCTKTGAVYLCLIGVAIIVGAIIGATIGIMNAYYPYVDNLVNNVTSESGPGC